MTKGRSHTLSGNAMWYAVASFFIFGALLGMMAIIDSKKAVRLAENEAERRRAKRVMAMGIAGISLPAMGFILGLFGIETSSVPSIGFISDIFGNGKLLYGVLFNSWLVFICWLVFKAVS